MSGPRQKTQKSEAGNVVFTAGEIFPDGCIIEPVTESERAIVALFGRKKTRVGAEIEYQGRRYRPIATMNQFSGQFHF